MLKRSLYRALTKAVGISFNLLNVMLAGNLPPFGSICVVVEDHERYLVIEPSKGVVAFPGGFMRWREHPARTAQREVREETGLEVHLGDVIGTYSGVSTRFARLSTLTLAYTGEIVGGALRGSIEGQPRWLDEGELRKRLESRYMRVLDDYLEYRKRHCQANL